jgi:hypothetical protein
MFITTTTNTTPNTTSDAVQHSAQFQNITTQSYHCTGHKDPNINKCSIKQMSEKYGGCFYHVIDNPNTSNGRDVVYHNGGSPKLCITTDL